MCRVCLDIFECIGHTSSIKLVNVSGDVNSDIWGKCEFQNFTGRAYDRVAQALSREFQKIIPQDTRAEIIILNHVGEAASLMLINEFKKHKVTIYTTDKQDAYLPITGNFNLIASLNSLNEFNRYKGPNVGYNVIDIWDSDFAVEVFSQTLGEEIITEHGCIDYVAVSVYDPSILIGVAKKFRVECGSSTKVIAVDSDENPIVYRWFNSLPIKEPSSPDPYLGLKYDTIPQVLVKNRDLIHKVITVNYVEVTLMWRKLLEEEKIPVGYISGSATAGLKKFVEKTGSLSRGGLVVLTDHVMNYIAKQDVLKVFNNPLIVTQRRV